MRQTFFSRVQDFCRSLRFQTPAMCIPRFLWRVIFVRQHADSHLSSYLKAPFAVLKTNGSVLDNKETTTITVMLTGKATTIGSM